jgi:M6 family metalloprotease-like protein
MSGTTATWSLPRLAAGEAAVLILEARALTAAQEPTVVWRNISTTATVTAGSASGSFTSHGPKVIPPSGGYESARYGDRPFPVVPVDYADFKHAAASTAAKLDSAINDPKNPGSTFNLYQEMSLGQLFPNGTVGSLGVDSRPVKAEDKLRFTTLDPQETNTCTGVTTVDPTSGEPSPAYTDRIVDGWYQLPGQRTYYGADANGSAVVGSVAGVGALQAIDSGCGPTAKLAYDAAMVADPDLDYSDYDTDKDGVVDFFEVIFQGCGGNGASQLGPAGGCAVTDTSDNVWPHSSSLEGSYTDPATGLTGYVSQDQLKDLEGRPLWYTDKSRTAKTTRNNGDALKVFVRVGPYNVNPETAIEKASVISHEYGHSLGLPDYYSTGSRSTYGDFSLMATDKSQHIDVIGKKELGWVVPQVIPDGPSTVTAWRDSKIDTRRIDWVTPAGKPYTLSAAAGDRGIHNAQAYVKSLPGRELLSPALVAQGASGKHVWYSQQGNDFGCIPLGGHNLDIALPGIEDVPAGTPVTATFKSLWDIEWDYDYGFVLTGKPGDNGSYSYTSHASAKGYTTPATSNPNANSCQSALGNGLTGSSGSYSAGQPPVDRVAGDYHDADLKFVEDSYDLSDLAGTKGGVLRFSYATDPGLARKGWFIDDLVVKAGSKVLFSSDFEKSGGPDDPQVYPGGCKEDLSTSGGICTTGWGYVAAGAPSELEHGYLLEMRDRSGFDFDGQNENDRDAIAFEAGLLLTYTDEAHGYGNAGTDDPPAQSPLDAKPVALDADPDLSDATFQAGQRYTDARATPHIDNYEEPARGKAKETSDTQPWTFDYDCLAFSVTALDGDTGNSATAFDLTGSVRFTTSSGCEAFNYGHASAVRAPTAPDVTAPAPEQPRPAAPTLAATGGLGQPLAAVLLLALAAAAVLVRRRTA